MTKKENEPITTEEPSAREVILDELEGVDSSSDDISIQGVPDRPSIPLYGSMNVPISREEEQTVEE